ncbi:prepilin peptidase [Alkalicella caledoniensis]|uniref:Prepilin peptidase n=1 Tax=Alkalicella caledoniensis TaxID=2731377 RepID=A0A7G9WBP9_ALKCA|nr:A24 family peptidase [Alkalicella caledoniensis]QNO16111.1 prepilin peptidase [Alkalicella caledoniensis]
MDLAIIAVFGLCLGSFLNVCIFRIPKKQSIVSPPSSCMGCGKKIPPLYLVPVVGYLISRGKCFNCKEKISIQYPIIEIVAAVTAVIVFKFFNNILDFIILYNLLLVLLAITVVDLEEMIIPDQFIIYLIICSVPYIVVNNNYINILVALGLGIAFYLIAVLSKGGMGGGDVKLAFVMGLYLGIGPGILAVFLSFVLGGLIGIVLLLTGASRKKAIPFAPYMVMGTVVALFWGEKIIDLYLKWARLI